MNKVRIFYGSSTGNTRFVAELIAQCMGPAFGEPQNIRDAAPGDWADADAYILGCSTWDQGEIQEDWRRFQPLLEEIDLTGKPTALFGLGDAYGYSGLFVQGLRELHDWVAARGAGIVGHWPAGEYRFEYSAALQGDHFLGLVIDQENEAEKTHDRVTRWVRAIKPDILGAGSDSDGPLLG